MSSGRQRWVWAVVVALVAASCGGGDGDDSLTTGAAATTVPESAGQAGDVTSSTGPETTQPGGAQDGDVTVAEVAPELAVFAELAAIEALPVSTVFDSAGGLLELAGGATLTASAGAVPDDTSLTVTIVGLALSYLDPRAGMASTYVIDSERDLPALDEPVVLEIPVPTETVGVAKLEDGEWVTVDVPAGDTTRVELTRFSTNYITAIPTTIEYVKQLGWMLGRSDNSLLKPSDAERVALENAHRERVTTEAEQATRDFYGLDDNGDYRAPTHTQQEMCAELQALLDGYDDFALPDQASPFLDTYALFRFLANADTPRNGFETYAGNFTGFWDLTSASMDQIEQQILASTEPLTPAQVLQIATDANGGNVSLGLLAAHNFLKDVAYSGRLQADPEPEGADADVTARYGEIATHLEPWRQTGPGNSIGRLDKMGSLYHTFAAAVAEVWFPNPGDLYEPLPGMGDAVTFGEQLMRIGFFTALNIPIDKNDVPDIEKARADRCGVGLGDTIITRRNEPPTPTTVATGQWRLVATNINPLDEPYDFVVGVTPNYYESPRFDGTFSKNTVSATAMVGRDRSVEREYQFYDMTTKVSIVGPPATMVPGKTITLEATGTVSGDWDGISNPGWRFSFDSYGWAVLEGETSFALGLSPDFYPKRTATVTPSFVVPTPRGPDDEIGIHAFGECSACWVEWVFRPDSG